MYSARAEAPLPSPGPELGISLAGVSRAAGASTPVAQWIERLLPKLKVAVSITVGGEGVTPGWPFRGPPGPRFFFLLIWPPGLSLAAGLGQELSSRAGPSCSAEPS